MLNPEEQIIIALDFWHIVTQEEKANLTEYDQVLLDYMYKRISKTTALIRIHNMHTYITNDNLRRSTEKNGWSLILKSSGGLDFVSDFENTINNLRKSFPGIKIGIATNDMPQLYEMLDQTKLKDILDFIVISSMIGCKKPSPEFSDYLRQEVGEGRILPVETFESEPTLMVGVETIRFDSRINTEPLFGVIQEYLSH